MTEDIKYFMAPEGDEPFWLEMAGISYCDGSYMIQRKNAGVYVFEYILSGTGTVRVGGKEYTASEGDCYILRKGTDHKYWCGDRNPWTKVFFNVGGELVERLLDVYGLTGRVVLHGCKVKELFMEFYKLTRQTTPVEKITHACGLKLHEILQTAYADTRDVPELSPDAAALKRQLRLSGTEERMKYPYHQMVSKGQLPLTIGGGIGQSRMCLLLLEKLHIGEVQASVWGEDVTEECEKFGIGIL